MFRYRELYDPVTRTKDMAVEEFLKYVEIRKRQDGQTDWRIVEEIKNQFFDTHAYRHSEESMNEWWSFIRPLVEKNAGLAQFVLDYEGAKSDFFFPWLKLVHTSPSAALEMSYGYGPNLRGNWHYSNYDRIDFFVRNDPTFVYNRERQLFVANLATNVREVRMGGEKTKVVDLGAGRMAWVRYHGFIAQPSRQTIMAYDSDPTIDPEVIFRKDPSKLGIDYTKGDFLSLNAIGNGAGANLFILQGVASYYSLNVFQNMMMRPIHQSLREGGVFFFDLQLDCPYYRRSVAIFDWPKMKLTQSASSAIDMVEQMRKELWKEGLRFSAEYALDTYNEVPTSVMITFTKI